MRAVVVGAGLGGLAAALRLQGPGADVDRGRAARRGPGGRADQIRDAGFTWDTGPSLLTMPWVLEETFAAGGLDLHRGAHAAPARPALPDPLGRRGAAPRLRGRPRRAARARWRSSPPRDAAQVEPFLAALRADLRATASSAPGGGLPARARTSLALVPRMVRLGALRPLYALRRAPLRAPAGARGVLLPLAVHRRRPVPRAGDLRRARLPPGARRRLVRRRRDVQRRRGDGAGRSTCAAASRSSGSSTPAGRVTGVVLAGGERIAADVVVSNADVLRTHELLGDAAAPRRRLRETMSCFLLYLGTDRVPSSDCSTTRCSSATATASSSAPSRAGASCPRDVLDLRPRAGAHRARRWRAPAATRSRSLLPVPNLRAGIDWERDADRLRDALVADLEATFGLDGLDATRRRRAPHDAAGLRARARGGVGERVRGRADAAPVRLVPPAEPRPPRWPGSTTSAAGRTRAPASPACCSAPRSPPGWSRTTTAARARALGRWRRAQPRPEPEPTRPGRGARDDEPRRADVRARLPAAPTPIRDDVYLPLPRVPHARRPRRRRDAGRRGAGRRRRRLGRGRRRRGPREVAVLEDLASRHPLPRATLARLLRGHALGPRRPPGSRPRRSSTPTATASPARSGSSWRRCSGRPTTPRARPRGGGARDGDAADEHPARPRRGRRRRALLPRARDDRPLRRAASPARARRCCATRSPRPTPATTRGWPGSALLREGRWRVRAAAWMYREILRQIERDGYGAQRRPRRGPAPPQARGGGAAGGAGSVAVA